MKSSSKGIFVTGKLLLKSIKNLSSNSDLHAAKSGRPLEVAEVSTEGLAFSLNATAVVGQLVSLDGKLTFAGNDNEFAATGRIESVTPINDRLNRFEVHLQQYDRQIWARFLLNSKKLQSRADKIFTAIRGDSE